MTAPGARGVADVSDFLLLQSVNRAQKLLSHWANDGSVHPVDLYAALVQMAGDFATFTEPSRRPSDYPPYRHGDLQRSFAPVVAALTTFAFDSAITLDPPASGRFGQDGTHTLITHADRGKYRVHGSRRRVARDRGVRPAAAAWRRHSSSCGPQLFGESSGSSASCTGRRSSGTC